MSSSSKQVYQVVLEEPEVKLTGRKSIGAARDRSEQAREHLLEWIRENHLEEKVERVSDATPFNVLYVEGDASSLERLAEAPGVASASPSGDGITVSPIGLAKSFG